MRTDPLRAWGPRLLIAALAVAGMAVLTLRGTTWSLDTWIYDRLIDHLEQPVDDRIVLVVVDERSLGALGRWPWSRGLHAQLVRELSKAPPRAIAFDVMFSEPARDDPGGDADLADAMRASGRVVSPVAVEPSRPGGPLIEVLPIPALTAASAALGHVEIDQDPDGVARNANLRAGLGEPQWPALAAAALATGDPDRPRDLPGLRSPAGDASPLLWHRDHRILLPYAADGFRRASYVDVLRGTLDPELFRDRWVLVGVVANGLSRELLPAGSDRHQRFPGIEYHAQVLNTLLQGNAILPLEMPQRLGLGTLLVLLPLLGLRQRDRFLRPWVVALATMATIVLTSALLLHVWRLWLPPTPALAVVAAGCMAWALLRLRSSQRMARSDALTQLANRHMFDLTLERELGSARRSGRPLSLLLVDVDHFKAFNDHYGHQAGDELLRSVADAMLGWTRRPRDLAARYGGDELALILPETSSQAALSIAHSLLDEVRRRDIRNAHAPTAPYVTLSIGAATFYPMLDGPEVDLVGRADAALYAAKQAGRNRAHGAPPPAGEG